MTVWETHENIGKTLKDGEYVAAANTRPAIFCRNKVAQYIHANVNDYSQIHRIEGRANLLGTYNKKTLKFH